MTDSARNSLVFVYPYEPGAYEASAHGHAQLRALGYGVEALVVPVLPGSPTLAPEVVERGELRVTIASDERSLRVFLAEKAESSIFVDFLFGLGAPSHRGRYVLPAIVDAGGRFIVVSGGALPPSDPSASVAQFRRRLTLAMNPTRLRDFLGRKVGRIRGAAQSNSLPLRVFSGRSEALDSFVTRTGIPLGSVTPVNSFDYDTYLRFLTSCRTEEPGRERIAVFLDEDASGHADFGLLADTTMAMDPDDYSASLRKLFTAVEEHTGLRVVVAAHPRADYSARPGFFGNRDIVTGDTVSLVARSSLVIAHASTAVSFAALADKPLMMVKTASMLSSSYGTTVDRIARGLEIQPICSDAPGALDTLDWDYGNWSRAGYSGYLERYVRSSDAPADKTTWEIVVETLQEEGYVAPMAR